LRATPAGGLNKQQLLAQRPDPTMRREIEILGGRVRVAQCAAMSKRTGERCRRPAARGRRVCAMHGGKSLAWFAHPNYRHGGYGWPFGYERRPRPGRDDAPPAGATTAERCQLAF
jgi:hypothetical protein